MQPQHYQEMWAGDGLLYYHEAWLGPEQLSERYAGLSAAAPLLGLRRRRPAASLIVTRLAPVTAGFLRMCCSHCSKGAPSGVVQVVARRGWATEWSRDHIDREVGLQNGLEIASTDRLCHSELLVSHPQAAVARESWRSSINMQIVPKACPGKRRRVGLAQRRL